MFPADLYANTTLKVTEFSQVAGVWELALESDRDRLALIFQPDPLTPERYWVKPGSDPGGLVNAPFVVYNQLLILTFRDVAGLVQQQQFIRSEGGGNVLTITEVLFRRL